MKIKKFNEELDNDFDEVYEEDDPNVDEEVKRLFIKALGTLCWSWGGDPAPEVTWAANDLLTYYERAHNVELGVRFEDEEMTDYNDVIAAIQEN